MYIDTIGCILPRMGRTQIYLGEEELELLDRAARETGASRSELIRRAIKARYRFEQRTDLTEEARAALREVAGIWKDRPFTSEQYIRAIRDGERLPDE
jgi:metal-responsive CopG/Arc/MetJ family transcriptional regulator